MNFSKTMVLSYASMALGVLVVLGILDVDSKASALESLNGLIGSGMVLYGIVGAALRKVTSSPLLGWLKKEKTE